MGSNYGHCPHCDAAGVTRERRPNGNDRCENGHVYPSSSAVLPPKPTPPPPPPMLEPAPAQLSPEDWDLLRHARSWQVDLEALGVEQTDIDREAAAFLDRLLAD